MKYFISLILILLTCSDAISAPSLERIIQTLPVFVSYSGVTADDGILTIGVFSDELPQVKKSTLETFENLRVWGHEDVVKSIGNKKMIAVALNGNNIAEFRGQVIWVIDAKASLSKIKKHSENGVFTIGSKNIEFEKYLFATMIFENKSDSPEIKRWRLTKFIVNCDISPIRFSNKITGKKYFLGKKCD
ncbi:MAG: hypothetical protein B6244_00685 [Candidatus Cloacimonetes bacterium 4572_55]|nr:MAG: hypothetical protein B6244_00685 [Candidatus Cloacimonetes bacterium 4572_55]